MGLMVNREVKRRSGPPSSSDTSCRAASLGHVEEGAFHGRTGIQRKPRYAAFNDVRLPKTRVHVPLEPLAECFFRQRQREEPERRSVRFQAGKKLLHDRSILHHPAKEKILQLGALQKTVQQRLNVIYDHAPGLFRYGKRLHIPAPVPVQKDRGRQQLFQLPAKGRFSRAHGSVDENQVFHRAPSNCKSRSFRSRPPA